MKQYKAYLIDLDGTSIWEQMRLMEQNNSSII